MKVFLVQSKLTSTEMQCVPTVFDTLTSAQEHANTLRACNPVYTAVQIVAFWLPNYLQDGSSCTIEPQLES